MEFRCLPLSYTRHNPLAGDTRADPGPIGNITSHSWTLEASVRTSWNVVGYLLSLLPHRPSSRMLKWHKLQQLWHLQKCWCAINLLTSYRYYYCLQIASMLSVFSFCSMYFHLLFLLVLIHAWALLHAWHVLDLPTDFQWYSSQGNVTIIPSACISWRSRWWILRYVLDYSGVKASLFSASVSWHWHICFWNLLLFTGIHF